jgi:hypothetical protein
MPGPVKPLPGGRRLSPSIHAIERGSSAVDMKGWCGMTGSSSDGHGMREKDQTSTGPSTASSTRNKSEIVASHAGTMTERRFTTETAA